MTNYENCNEKLIRPDRNEQERHDYHYFRHYADAFWTGSKYRLLDTKHI